MKKILPIFVAIYTWLLKFYPHRFRDEFAEEMLLDFKDTLNDSCQNGMLPLFLSLLREMRDIPINVLQVHLEENYMRRIINSQPVRAGFRGAIGFGLAFAGAGMISSLFIFGLTSRIPLLNRLGMIFLETFKNENRPPNFSILYLILSIVTALVFGLLFAFFFAERFQFQKYFLTGLLGWFAPNAIISIFHNTIDTSRYIDGNQSFNLMFLEEALMGAFLGLIFSVAKSESRKPLRLLMAAAFIFPITTYLYVKALYYFDLVTTRWFFTALTIMMLVYFAGVVMIAFSSKRQIPWLVFVGAFVYFYGEFIPSLILPPQSNSWTSLLNNITSLPILGTIVFHFALQQALIGLPLGFILGLLLGFGRKNTSQPIMA